MFAKKKKFSFCDEWNYVFFSGMSVREWLMEDKKLLQLLSTVCKFDDFIDDHNTTSKHTLTHLVLVQRMQKTKQGWKRMPRKGEVTNANHDDAWVCKYYGKSHFCKNPLYLGKDGELHMSRVTTGMEFQATVENPLVQANEWTDEREVNVVMSLVEACQLLKELQNKRFYKQIFNFSSFFQKPNFLVEFHFCFLNFF